MIKVGITGQSGFIGTHLFNTLNLDKETYLTIPFDDDFFSDIETLTNWVSCCDVIVHLAAVNRHSDPQFIFTKNIELVQKLILAIETAKKSVHVIFSSSIQENLSNIYGNSKKKGRRLFENWAQNSTSSFTSFIIPNVFGPFCKPYYNSVVATFCHQLTHNENPKIEIDSELKLIYVGELVELIKVRIKRIFRNNELSSVESVTINPTSVIKVSELLQLLNGYKKSYFEEGIIPNITNNFERNLFSTFICYIDHNDFFPFRLKLSSDNRGAFVEVLKVHCGGQISFSTTGKGITRGNHYHTRKAERFAVIRGKAVISLRKINSNNVLSFEMDGKKPSFVDMPIWHTHCITNTGDEDVYTIFWINELYDPKDPDTYFEEVIR